MSTLRESLAAVVLALLVGDACQRGGLSCSAFAPMMPRRAVRHHQLIASTRSPINMPATVSVPYRPNKRAHHSRTCSSALLAGQNSRSNNDNNVPDTRNPTASPPPAAGDEIDDDVLIPSTPCVRICRYNANFYDGQVCIGCYRDTHEIGSWSSMDAAERCWALMDAADRCPPPSCSSSSSSSGSLNASTSDFLVAAENDDGDDSRLFGGAISREELLRQAKAWEREASRN